MLITRMEAKDAGLNISSDDIKAMAMAIIAHTNNHFHLNDYTLKIKRIEGKRLYFDGLNLTEMGDLVEVLDIKYLEGFHEVLASTDEYIEIDTDITIPEETDVNGLLYLVKFPADVKAGVKKAWKHQETLSDKIGIRTESISRWSTTYESPSSGETINGMPAYLFDFLDPYMKMRWS